MVFTSTSSWKPENVNFFKKLEIDEIEFCPYPEFPYAEKRNRPGFVNTSPTYRRFNAIVSQLKMHYFSGGDFESLISSQLLKKEKYI